jgi:hypothetical protein
MWVRANQKAFLQGIAGKSGANTKLPRLENSH